MLPNASSLMSSGTALVFKSLAELQCDAAQMQIDNQQVLQDLFKYEPALLKGALQSAQNQAFEQMQDGWVKFGEGITSAAVSAGCVVIGNFRNPLPPENPEANVTLKADDAVAEETENTAQGEETVQLTGNRLQDNTAATNAEESETVQVQTKKQTKTTQETEAETEKQNQKDLDQKAEKALQAKLESVYNGRNLWSGLIANQAAAVTNGAYSVGDGYVQKEITENNGNNSYLQGLTQMTQATISQITSSVQSREQQEKSAADAFIQVEQLAGFRA